MVCVSSEAHEASENDDHDDGVGGVWTHGEYV